MKIIENMLCWVRKKACVQLHIPHCEVWLTLEFFDEYGNLTKRRKQRSKSWVRNAYTAACLSMMHTDRTTDTAQGNPTIILLTGGAMSSGSLLGLPTGDQRLVGAGGWNADNTLRGGTASADRGIVIGRGTTAESFTDYALATLIAYGYGTNQICHQEQDIYTIAYTSGTKTMKATHSRIYNNNSDANISLTETGLYGHTRYTPGGSSTWMTCRDLLSPAETFTDKAQLRVTYEISLTYPY